MANVFTAIEWKGNLKLVECEGPDMNYRDERFGVILTTDDGTRVMDARALDSNDAVRLFPNTDDGIEQAVTLLCESDARRLFEHHRLTMEVRDAVEVIAPQIEERGIGTIDRGEWTITVMLSGDEPEGFTWEAIGSHDYAGAIERIEVDGMKRDTIEQAVRQAIVSTTRLTFAAAGGHPAAGKRRTVLS